MADVRYKKGNRVESIAPLQPSTAPRRRLGIIYRIAILLYVLAVVLLSYQQGLTLFAKGAGMLLAGLFVFRALSGSEKIFIPAEYKFLIAWFVVGVISSALSKEPATAFPRVLTLLQIFPIAFVISNFIVWNGDSKFYWLFVVGAALVSGLISLSNPMKFSEIDGRMFGTLDHPNAFAALMAVCASLCLAGSLGIRLLIGKMLCLFGAAFFLYLVGRSGSRTGALASIAGVLTVATCLQMARKRKGVARSMTLVLLGGVLVVATSAYLISTEFGGRLLTLAAAVWSGNFEATGETSLPARLWMYRKGFQLALENPIFGVGLDVFRTADFIGGRVIGNNSHSNYIEIFVSTGFIGGSLYFAMYYCWWARLFRGKLALQSSNLSVHYAMATSIAAALLMMDIGWATYFEKLPWLLIAGLIAEANLIAGHRGKPRA